MTQAAGNAVLALDAGTTGVTATGHRTSVATVTIAEA